MGIIDEANNIAIRVLMAAAVLPLKVIPLLARKPKQKAIIVKTIANRLSKILQSFDTTHDLLIEKAGYGAPLTYSTNGKFVQSNAGTDRYIKQSGCSDFEGYKLIEQLERFGIFNPKNIVDVGANFGEISLCFLERFPNILIVAIEASRENVEILRENVEKFPHDTSKLIVLHKAVSDQNEPIKISTGLGSQNSTTMLSKMSSYELIQTIGIDEVYRIGNVEVCDFLKIDIEGGEPGLKESLAGVLSNTRAVLVEFSYKNSIENYEKLANTFEQASDAWLCYDAANPDQPIQPIHLIEDFRKIANAKKYLKEYWFVNTNLVTSAP